MKLLLLTALLGVAYVAAECPEACNGHGFCGEYDKCSCYRNWQGNSCADRTCPHDIAFVDIPHGDLNMDGKLDDEITLYGAQINDVYAFEVYPTDGYQINRNPDNDNPANDASSDDEMYTSTSAREKAASFYDMAEDGHFYAECSNKGMCDRKSGQCDCFDGYSGAACRRVACPNDCSGHGTCETIQETSISDTETYSYQLWDRYKTQVCQCDPGYFGIDCAQRNCPFGDDPLSTDQHNEIQWLTLRTHGDGTAGPIDVKDGDGATGGDTEYSAGDLDLEGTFTLGYKDEFGEYWNTSPIKAISYDVKDAQTANNDLEDAIEAALEGIPNSVFEDVEVEVWPIQTPIAGVFDCATTAGTCDLLDGSANLGTADGNNAVWVVTNEQTGSPITGAAHKWGISNCARAGDGGKFIVGVTAASGELAGADDTADVTLLTGTDQTICRYDMNGFRAKITFKSNPGDIEQLTCDASLVTTKEHKDSAEPDTDIQCTAEDSLSFELGAFGTALGSQNGGGGNGQHNYGQIVTNQPLAEMMTHGDRIKFTPNGGTEGVYTIAGPIYNPTSVCSGGADTAGAAANGDVCVADSECAGDATCAGAPILSTIIVEEETAAVAIATVSTPKGVWHGKGTSENVECSHRGLCNHDEGLCECFTGYTHDDCSRQDALNA